MHEHDSLLPACSSRHWWQQGFGIAMLLCASALTPLWAAQGSDCAPMGSMPHYKVADSPQMYTYKNADFTVSKGDDTEKRTVAGRYCYQAYDVEEGIEPTSALETQSNYRDQLNRLGAQIVYSGDNETDARLVKDGHTTWIQTSNNGDAYVYVTVVTEQPFAATLSTPASTDYPLFGHMPNYAADDAPTRRNFDQATFNVQDGDDAKEMKIQGALFRQSYSQKTGASLNSLLDIQQNYRHALTQLGAQILYATENETDARLDHAGQTVWVSVSNNGELYTTLTVVEEKAFQASLKPPVADELKSALDKDGHVALYINFDFDKASLCSDATPVIAQVVALLKANPDLKLSVEGNTDNVGGHDYNVKLSQARAASVVAELIKGGITAERLTSTGSGPDKPIADNTDSAGRAKNRRVELVKA